MDVMIIGVQKAGTSTLQEMMKSDDRIRTHYSEEFGYFLDFDKRSYDEWIKSSFERERDSHELILGKCVDLFVDKKALMKLRKEFPKVKVVIVLRDPIDRIESAFNYCRSRGYEKDYNIDRSVLEELRYEGDTMRYRNCNYLFTSDYPRRLNEIWSVFARENVLLLDFNELRDDSMLVLSKVYSFIGLNMREDIVYSAVKKNEFKGVRYPWINRLLLVKGTLVNSFWKVLPARVRERIIALFYRLNSKTSSKQKLSNRTKEILNKRLDFKYQKYVD